jgi:hypothetical protein
MTAHVRIPLRRQDGALAGFAVVDLADAECARQREHVGIYATEAEAATAARAWRRARMSHANEARNA